MSSRNLIHIQPTRDRRVGFARWAVAQRPKVGTVGPHTFAVPARLFPDIAEELLIGAVVDGRPYVSPDEPQAAAVPEREGIPGEPLPPVPDSAYPPDAVPLPPPDFAPLEDAPADDSDRSDAGTDEGPNSDGRFACGGCPRDFSTKRGRDLHQRQAHPEA
ncbi:hypothetical protein PV341_07880 [Streptomyces sp. PA03-1a]|nr:hypothetical protein [Streptomyces sp. PA03-1a]MDX2813431.1 hypothetical protein [Streptomyces sp. PA03-5A]